MIVESLLANFVILLGLALILWVVAVQIGDSVDHEWARTDFAPLRQSAAKSTACTGKRRKGGGFLT